MRSAVSSRRSTISADATTRSSSTFSATMAPAWRGPRAAPSTKWWCSTEFRSRRTSSSPRSRPMAGPRYGAAARSSRIMPPPGLGPATRPFNGASRSPRISAARAIPWSSAGLTGCGQRRASQRLRPRHRHRSNPARSCRRAGAQERRRRWPDGNGGRLLSADAGRPQGPLAPHPAIFRGLGQPRHVQGWLVAGLPAAAHSMEARPASPWRILRPADWDPDADPCELYDLTMISARRMTLPPCARTRWPSFGAFSGRRRERYQVLPLLGGMALAFGDAYTKPQPRRRATVPADRSRIYRPASFRRSSTAPSQSRPMSM